MAGEERIGQLDLVLADEQVLAIALEERPATVRPDRVGDERPDVFPMVATTTTIQKFQGCPVMARSGSGPTRGSPAYGRISSEGSGIIADSMAMASMTPR